MDRPIYTIYGDDACAMTLALMREAGIAQRIPSGASIALKPNLVVAKPPESGATTHAGVLEGAILYLQEHGFSDISIIESAWVGANTASAIRACGYDVLSRKYNVPIFDLKHDAVRTVSTQNGDIAICQKALDADYLINMPVLKGHCQTVMTCALKNLKGCIPDREKRNFHARGLTEPIAALAAALKPNLVIVDSICGDLNFEEGGTPVQTRRMMLGFDAVQMDVYGCGLMGIDPRRVGYIPLAEKYGAGSMALKEEDVIATNTPEDGPVVLAQSGVVSRLTRNVEQRSACSACYGNLVHALYRMENERRAPYKGPICIGQDFKDVPVDAVGIGQCCNRAKLQAQGCPPSAVEIMRVLSEAGASS